MNNAADNLPPDGSFEPEDALRSIGDIGPRYADALRQIGVHTPSDLARYSPELLAQELREKAGVRVTPDRIRAKDWIGQAQKLAQDLAKDPAQQRDAEPENSSGMDEAGWRERGMFSLRFIERYAPEGKQWWQIRVYHEGGTGPEMLFEGLDPNPWVQWIFAQMGLPEQEVQSPVGVEPPAAPDLLEVEEEMVVLEQPSGEPGDAFPAAEDAQQIAGEEEFGIAFGEVDVNAWPPAPARFLEVAAHIRFQGEHARELAQERTPFLLEFYLINLVSQQSSRIISNQGQMEPDRDEYELRQNFAMPAPGQYELQTFVLLPNQNKKAFRDGPVFQVVAEAPRSGV